LNPGDALSAEPGNERTSTQVRGCVMTVRNDLDINEIPTPPPDTPTQDLPSIYFDGAQYEASWPQYDFSIILKGLKDSGRSEFKAEIAIVNSHSMLHWSSLSLLSLRSRREVANELTNSTIPYPVDWYHILTTAAYEIVKLYRQGEPVVPVGKKPDTLKLEYQLEPILEKGQPTTIYGSGGSAKSYLADYIAVLVQFNFAGMSWLPTAGNVLYLDWESSQEDHDRRVWAIKAGLGIDSEDTFLYRQCSQPLVSDIVSLQQLTAINEINLVIIDSQMAATGYGTDPAQTSSQYYNALRSLQCTTLTIDHVSKEDWKGVTSSVGPYGSVVKYNRSRSQFEIKKSQDAGDNFLELSLTHRKHNEGRLLKPIGLRINFNESPSGELESVTFEGCNVADNPELSGALPLTFLIKDLLKHGPLTNKEITEQLDANLDSVRVITHRLGKKGTLIKVGDSWGLKQVTG